MILDFVKEHLHLSSPVWLVILLGAGTLWLWRRPLSRGPRWYFTSLVLGYWFATTPFGAGLLVDGLSRGLTRVTTPDQAGGADAVVVLGGGAWTAMVGGETGGVLTSTSLMRALEGVRVFKLIGARVLIVSGGVPRPTRQLHAESRQLRDAVVKAGVPAASVVEESQSTSTREQARLVGPILREQRIHRFVLVTSPMHMRRALAVFRAAGFDPVASIAPVRSEQLLPPYSLVPDGESWMLSDMAVYDYFALVYYWGRGWLKPARP
jgi:uncharacterized SAM-binding protein YcdF (DUF218 family)